MVEEVRTTRLDGGYGYLSSLFRLNLRWSSSGAEEAPETLVVKLPLQARLDEMTPDAERMFRREATFHRVVAPTAPIRTAKAWVAEIDNASGAATLVFEDLGKLESFDDNKTVSVERVENSLVKLASLHAMYWQSSELETMDWLAHPAESGVDQVSTERFAALWPRLAESGAYDLSSTQLRLGELLSTKLEGVYEALHRGPKTLIHADLHQENLFFDEDNPVFIDWAAAERANPAKDIAKLTASCLEPGTVSHEQPRLIRRYREELGRSDVLLKQLERDVHLATCHYLAMMTFLSDTRDFDALATNIETRTDFTSSRVIAACDNAEMVAAVEEL